MTVHLHRAGFMGSFLCGADAELTQRPLSFVVMLLVLYSSRSGLRSVKYRLGKGKRNNK